MNTNLKLVAAVLRKDLWLFWPLAVLAALLNALVSFGANELQFMALGFLLEGVTGLASALLILLVFHADSAVSGNRDWLTRPVPGLTLLAAKSVFVVLAILLPGVLGFMLLGFDAGRPPAEVVVAGVLTGLSGAALLNALGTMVVAALTSSIRQTIVAFLAGIVLLGTAFGLLGTGSYPDFMDMAPGTIWMLWNSLLLLATFTALGVLWILYRRRGRATALALSVAAALIGGTIFYTTTWSRMFAIQQRVAPDPAAASAISVSLLPRCFPDPVPEVAGEPSESPGLKLPMSMFTPRQQARAGTDPVQLSVRLITDHVPEGGRVVATRSGLTYRTAAGEAVSLGQGRTVLQWVRTDSGQLAIDQYWMLSKQDYERLVADPGITTHLDYSLSLLQPEETAVFTADGSRSYQSGIGFCGAPEHAWAGEELVTCHVVGDQPALLAVGFEGDSSQADRPGGELDFTPAVLDFWGGRRHAIRLDDVTGRQVRVTTYEARAHFSRQFDVPGMLGGVSSCPAH